MPCLSDRAEHERAAQNYTILKNHSLGAKSGNFKCLSTVTSVPSVRIKSADSSTSLQHERRTQTEQPTLFVVVFHSDDLSSSGSSAGQNSGGIQGLDGERVNYTDVLPYELIRRKKKTKHITRRAVHQASLTSSL